MNKWLKVVTVFAVVTLGTALGAGMHQQVKRHDAQLRTPGEYAERIHDQKVQRCLQSSNPDGCALYFGLAI